MDDDEVDSGGGDNGDVDESKIPELIKGWNDSSRTSYPLVFKWIESR